MKILPYIVTTIVLCISPLSSVFGNIDDLELKGKGDVYYLGFIKVYNASLYADNKVDTIDILATDISKCLKLEYAVSLKAEDFIKSADQILQNQHQPETLLAIEKEIATLNSAYKAVKDGDHYLLCYDAPSQTTKLLLNNTLIVEIVSTKFSEMYFGIWLGPRKPIDTDLRNDLLGQK